MRILSWLLLTMAVGLAAGCQSNLYYQNQAARRAREFLLEESPELTRDQREFVTFNPPVFLFGNILAQNNLVGEMQLSSELSQVCITWLIPGQEEAYLVYGVSNKNMYNWSPNRLIRKKFEPVDRKWISAVQKARTYLWNNLFNQLSSAEANSARFANPEIVKTTFPPEFKTPLPSDEPQSDLSRLQQFSMVWPAGERLVVICGYAQDDQLTNWNVNFGGLFTAEEFNHYRSTEEAAQ